MALPLFYEQTMPQAYYVMYKGNVFLGVEFSAAQKDRLAVLEDEFLQEIRRREADENWELFRQMFFHQIARKSNT